MLYDRLAGRPLEYEAITGRLSDKQNGTGYLCRPTARSLRFYKPSADDRAVIQKRTAGRRITTRLTAASQ
jgi:hypothetical protein